MALFRHTQPKGGVRAPRRWSARAAWATNALAMRLGLRPPFSRKSSWERPPPWQVAVQKRWAAFWGAPFPEALAILVVCASGVVIWRLLQPTLQLNDLWPELAGMTLDVFVILVVYESFRRRRDRASEIARQQETIDDYKRWDSEEARHRIAGAIRRLNRLGVVELRLAGLSLSDFQFAKAEIHSLAGSTFYDGTWGEPLRQAEVRLSRVSFAWVNCRGVVFSPFDPFEVIAPEEARSAILTDCDFFRSDLRDASFNGAALFWTEAPPKSHYVEEENDDGSIGMSPVSVGPFDETDLAGASFRACAFRNAEFRGAMNLQQADFFRAMGLETAIFDNAEDRSYALTSASRKARPES